MKLRYFAWVRERIGKPEEEIEPPAGDRDGRRPDGLARRRAARNTPMRSRTRKVIRAAIDRAHVRPDAAIAGAREIAFFPPMTGG